MAVKSTGSLYTELISLLLAGGLIGGVFSFGLPAWLLPLLLLPLLDALLRSRPEVEETNDLLKLSYFFIPFYAVVFIWAVTTYLGSVVISPAATRLVAVTSLLTVTIAWTALSLPLALVFKKVRRSATPWLTAAWLLPSAWVVCEWLRSLGASLLFWGPSGSIGDYWDQGNFGLAAINTPWAGLSRLGGMYGLSWLVVLAGVLLYFGLAKRSPKLLAGLAGLLIVGGVGGHLLIHTTGTVPAPRPASVLQQHTSIDPLDYPFLVSHPSPQPKDLVVLPEYSGVFDPGNEPFARQVESRLSDRGVSLTVGTTFEASKRYGALEAVDRKGDLVQLQTKQLLIPSGEYMPVLLRLQLNLTGHASAVRDFQDHYRLHRGQQPQLLERGGLVVGPVACSGILARDIYRQFANSGAQVLTNSADLLIFKGSRPYFRQSLMMARFHAIANDRVFIQATQGDPGFAIDANGRYIVKPGDDNSRFIDFSFRPHSDKTLYTRLGDWPLWLAGVAIVISALGLHNRAAAWYQRNRR